MIYSLYTKILITIILAFYLFAVVMMFREQVKTQYCGKVTSMYRQDPAYKSSAEAHVIFYSDSLKRKIDAKVSNNTYANTQIGQSQCFKLSDCDLKD